MNSFGRKDSNKKEKQTIFTAETFGVVLILFSALIMVCLVSGDKIFSLPGLYVSSFLFGLLGYFSYSMVIFTAFLGVLLVTGKKTGLSKKRKALISVMVISLAFILHVATMQRHGNLSYGQFLSFSYKLGAGGVFTCSGGGVISALVVYPFLALLTHAGVYVLFSIVLIVTGYFLFKDVSLDRVKDSRGASEKFDSSYKKPSVLTVDIPKEIEGVKDYPIETISEAEISSKQKLFVKNAGDFAFKTRKEVKNEETSSGIKIKFVSGVGQAVYESGIKKGPTVSTEYKEKLDYIKTPPKIDFASSNSIFGKKEEKSTVFTQTVNVSSPISVNDSPKQEIPYFEHVDSAEFRAKAFSENYALLEDDTIPVKSVPDVQEYALDSDFSLEEQREVLTSVEIPVILEDGKEDDNYNALNQVDNNEIETLNVVDGIENIEHDSKDYLENATEFNEPNDPIIDSPAVEPPVSRVETRRTRDLFGGLEMGGTGLKSEQNLEGRAFESRAQRDGNRASVFSSLNQKEEIKQEDDTPYAFKDYVRPPLELLETYEKQTDLPEENHAENMEIIKRTLAEFRINAEPQGYVHGPSITRYEIMMPSGIPVKNILRHDDDLQMRLAVREGVRIEAPIPGKNMVGIEVANKYKATVGLREIMEGMAGQKSAPYSLMFGIGKDVVGTIKSDDLAKGPHFLVAGTTGSGKSVCLNGIITSLIMRYGPQDLRFILIDPKRVEFKKYEHLPHLLVDEIINEPQKVLAALAWAYEETERRNILFENCEVPIKDLEAYNTIIAKDGKTRLPRIVIIVDELSDLMARCKKELDEKICMIAQKARSAGIHLVLATQYPSTQVITMTMKANLPSRIGFKVASHVESGVILNESGAEKLLGNGDMLYKNSRQSNTERYQGAFITDREIHGIVSYIRENNECHFDVKLTDRLEKAMKPKSDSSSSAEAPVDTENPENIELLKKALVLAITSGTISISQLQRRFQIGYSRAGGLVDRMEQLGYISPNEGNNKPRQVYITREEYEENYGPFID